MPVRAVTSVALPVPCGLLVQAGVRSQFAPPVLRRARRSIASSFRGSADDARFNSHSPVSEPGAHPKRPRRKMPISPYARVVPWSYVQAKLDTLWRSEDVLNAESACVERGPSSSMTVDAVSAADLLCVSTSLCPPAPNPRPVPPSPPPLDHVRFHPPPPRPSPTRAQSATPTHSRAISGVGDRGAQGPSAPATAAAQPD